MMSPLEPPHSSLEVNGSDFRLASTGIPHGLRSVVKAAGVPIEVFLRNIN
ncbi:hypothetical protein RISK_002790 [Rhodopirellula islandica]|uniref:Uncharacterized protein n=1 Tax=Rhodopirellula islandica TaxID=595434 RepID=A0A0J1BEL5_RHOIS|nr:hypothetical protein RISK_002790 [Rhodopirellula islandica]